MVGFQTENKQRLRDVAALIAVALMLLWPAFVNGEPFYMADTPSYLRGADGAVHELTGASSAWSDELQKRFADGAPALKSAEAQHASAEPAVVLKGRSIYYGALLYAAQWLGNFWAVAILQALLCAVAIVSTVATIRRAMGRETTHLFTVGTGVALAAFAVIPGVVIASNVFRVRVREAYRAIRTRLARINAFLQERMSAVRVVQLFGREQAEARLRELATPGLLAIFAPTCFSSLYAEMMTVTVGSQSPRRTGRANRRPKRRCRATRGARGSSPDRPSASVRVRSAHRYSDRPGRA